MAHGARDPRGAHGACGADGARRQGDVKRIFDHVADLPVGERDAALDRECGDDLALRSGVVGLLAALDESVALASTGADRPAGARVPPPVSVPRPPLGQADGGPTAIGKYRDLSRIGQGAMGTVYRAHDPVLDRPVAIKTIRTAGFLGSEEATVRRFHREARIAAGLNHPSIVTVYDFGQ
ncbi:MAG: hypothetical protein AAFX50_17505, partial [Acidobacteriota bacterium]